MRMRILLNTLMALLVFVSAAQAAAVVLAPVDTETEYIYPEPNGYNNAYVTVDYEVINDNFRANLVAYDLKPDFTYQVKLEGIPACAGGDDETNERIGYSGRWSCLDCEASPAGNNRSDAQYEANKLLPDGHPDKECIAGYLVFDYFVSDSNGDADVWIETDASYHVLWCGPVSGSNADLYSGYTPSGAYCTDGKYCTYENITPETERPAFHYLPDGQYLNVRIALTEESFHQDCGTWCTVLQREILFEIDRYYDTDADGCINILDPNPGTPSADTDGDDYGADCDCDDDNGAVNPGAPEAAEFGNTCSDGLDNDCDGFTDGQDVGCPGGSWGVSAQAHASVTHVASFRESRIVNRLAMLLLPAGVVFLLRVLAKRRRE
jgi:hypothetical protein